MSKTLFIGDNLRVARLLSGFSLQDLGSRVGTTRQYIQQLETTDKSPADDLLDALAYELKVNKRFFQKPLGSLVKDEECHFRKLATVPISSVRECTARATLVNKLAESLNRLLELPDVNFPGIDVQSKAEAEDAAQECRRYWKLGQGPIKSVARVIEHAGGVITTFGAVSQKVDALSLFRERPIVVLNPQKSRPRLRFDLAHELGHIIMHRGIESGDRGQEDEANHFASCFLLPRQVLIQEYQPQERIDWQKIYDLKVAWGVSARAIIYSLNQLQLITPSQFRTANVYLSKTGQTKSEERDHEVHEERAELLENALQLLIQEYGSSLGGLLDDLGISMDFLAELTQLAHLLEPLAPDPSDRNVVSLFRNR